MVVAGSELYSSFRTFSLDLGPSSSLLNQHEGTEHLLILFKVGTTGKGAYDCPEWVPAETGMDEQTQRAVTSFTWCNTV